MYQVKYATKSLMPKNKFETFKNITIIAVFALLGMLLYNVSYV